jgi:hypothetical protein
VVVVVVVVGVVVGGSVVVVVDVDAVRGDVVVVVGSVDGVSAVGGALDTFGATPSAIVNAATAEAAAIDRQRAVTPPQRPKRSTRRMTTPLDPGRAKCPTHFIVRHGPTPR